MGSKEGTLNFRSLCNGKVWGKSEIRYEAQRRQRRLKRKTRAPWAIEEVL
jgi:hypothetical protein